MVPINLANRRKVQSAMNGNVVAVLYVGAGFFFCTCNKDDTEKSNNTGPK